MGMIFSLIRKIASTNRKIIQKTIKETQNGNVKPFCSEFWGNVQDAGELRFFDRSSVPHHSKLNTFNHILVRPYEEIFAGEMQKTSSLLEGKSPYEILKETDIAFKRLKPTEENITVYRCIGEKPDFFKEYALYKKACNIKVGEKLTMPEYAYAASDKNYAMVYAANNRGIMYEIVVPKGSKVSLTDKLVNGKLPDGNECVFPRSSHFECLEKTIDENGLIHIKLKYLIPKENWRA